MCQSILCGEGGKALPILAAYTTVPGAEPEQSLSILENRPHPIVCQTVLCGEGGKGLPIITAYTAAIGSKPDQPLSILDNRPYNIARQSILCGEGGKALSIISAYTTFGAEPERSFSVLRNRKYIKVCKQKGEAQEVVKS